MGQFGMPDFGDIGVPGVNFPNQSGNNGKVLYTDGATPFWGDLPSVGPPSGIKSMLNIMDYGAVGDNSTDDSAAFQAAINDMYVKKDCCLYLPTRDFIIDRRFITPDANWVPYIASYNISTNEITFDRAHQLATGKSVSFYAGAGVAPGGTTSSEIYFANVTSSTKIKLYNTKANAITGGATGLIALTGTAVSSIDTSANTLIFGSPHGFSTGQKAIIYGTVSQPGGVSVSTGYYLRVIDSLTVSLHPIETSSSLYNQQNAFENESIIDITDSGSGTIYVLPVGSHLNHRFFQTTNCTIISNGARLIKGPTLGAPAGPVPGVGLGVAMFQATFTSNIYLEGIRWYGSSPDELDDLNGSTNSVSDGLVRAGDDGCRFNSCSNVIVVGNEFYDFGDGLMRMRNSLVDDTFGNNSDVWRVTNCIFENDQQMSTTASGSKAHGGVRNVIFDKNTVRKFKGAVKFATKRDHCSNLLIVNNVFDGSTLNDNAGAGVVTIEDYYNIQIINNNCEDIIDSNNSGGFVQVVTNNSNTAVGHPYDTINITGNIVKNCGRGINLVNSSFFDGTKNVYKNVNIRDNVFDGISGFTAANGVINLSTNVFRNANIEGNTIANSTQACGINFFIDGGVLGTLHNNLNIRGNILDNLTHSTATGIRIALQAGSSFTINNVDVTGNICTLAKTFLDVSSCRNLTIGRNNFIMPGATAVNASNCDRIWYDNNHFECKTDTNGVKGNGIIHNTATFVTLSGNYVEATGTAYYNNPGTTQSQQTYDMGNIIIGALLGISANQRYGPSEGLRRKYYYAATPTSAGFVRTFNRGDIIVRPQPATGGPAEQYCNLGGTFGSFAGATPTLTNNYTSASTVLVSDTSDFQNGDYVKFGTSSTVQIKTVDSLLQLTLMGGLTASAGDAAAFITPTFASETNLV